MPALNHFVLMPALTCVLSPRRGFAEQDIQILMAVGKLTPLGDSAPNAPKWFAAVEIIRVAGDQDWLHKATKEISKYWRNKRQRHTRQVSAGILC